MPLSIGQFYGIDSIIELITLGVALFIFYYTRKIFKITKEGEYRFLGLGFLAIALSFVFKIISNLTILYSIKLTQINFVAFITEQLENMSLVNFFSFTLYKLFYLAGFLLLFFMTTQVKNKEKAFLFLYLGIITILFSIYFNFVFHMTLILILLFLTFNFYQNYKNVKTKNSYLVFWAFLVILLSHIFLLFAETNYLFYLIGEIIMLMGFSFLLINQINIKNEQKKNKAGSIKGHLGSVKKRQGN